MIRCKGGRGRQLTCPCIAGQPLAIIVNKKGMQRDKSNNIVPAEQQELNKRKLVPIVEHSTTSTKDYHIVHQSNLVTAGVGGSSRRVPLLGPGPRGPGAEVITKNEEEIRGGGGRRGNVGGGGSSVAIPPTNATSFRRTNEPREQHEEYVIRERYFSRPPAAEEDIAVSAGPPGGGSSGPRLGPVLKPNYPSTWTTVTHASHLESSSGASILRDSSAMLTPETPEEFRPRIHRNPEIRSRPLMDGGEGGDDNSNNLLYPSSNHTTSLLRPPFSGAGPRPQQQVPQPQPPQQHQDLRHHPFAQDSVFCHQIPTKPFRAITTTTNNTSSSSDPLASTAPSGLSSISPINSTTTFSIRGPSLHSNIQNLSSIIRNTRPIEIKSHHSSGSNATTSDEPPPRVTVTATDLSPTIQHQQPTSWHRPVKVNTTPTLVPTHLSSSPIPHRHGPGPESGLGLGLGPKSRTPFVGSGSPAAGSPPTSTAPLSSMQPSPAPPNIPHQSGTSSEFPTHFRFGSLIQLSSGDLKTVESLTTQDFIHSAETSPDVRIDHSIVTSVEIKMEKGTANISFSVGKQKVQVCLYNVHTNFANLKASHLGLDNMQLTFSPKVFWY